MNFSEMNHLVKEIRELTKELANGRPSASIEKKRSQCLASFKNRFAPYLTERLHNTYKNYFPFEQPLDLENYFTNEGVPVELDGKGVPRIQVAIEANPTRIVLKSTRRHGDRVAWQITS